jgi:transcriptional regulator with XRE-family HTH domain
MQDTLARKLRVLRAERGLTLREAERLTGVDKDTLSKIERGIRHPYDVTLSKIAEGYDVPVGELLEEPALPLAETPQVGAAESVPGSVEELLERRHTKTRHLADPHLAQKFEADVADEDVLKVEREIAGELEAVGEDLVRIARYHLHNTTASGIYSEVSKQFMIARYSIAARKGQEFVDVRRALDVAGRALAA